MDFREYVNQSEISELTSWVNNFKSNIIRSLRKQPGYITLKIGSLSSSNILGLETSNNSNELIRIKAEATEKGWKGKAALAAADSMGLGWDNKDKNRFYKAMNGGQHSLPALVGSEMGLLFEVEVFIFLVETFKLKPVGKTLSWAKSEVFRIGGLITKKVGQGLGRLVIEFIHSHASGRSGMGNLIYDKAMSLVRECVVDCIEFTGGNNISLKNIEDTADLRIGCAKYLPGIRKDVGFSLKAVTETQVNVRNLGSGKALSLLGASKRVYEDIANNPLYDDVERKSLLLTTMEKYGERNFANKPRRFAKLLETLVTGGADTIPAYRSLLSADSSPGWSPAINKDFVTGEGPTGKLGAKSSSVIEVMLNSTYMKLVYMVDGGNHYGTSVQFEPTADGKQVSVVVSNLINRGVKNG